MRPHASSAVFSFLHHRESWGQAAFLSTPGQLRASCFLQRNFKILFTLPFCVLVLQGDTGWPFIFFPHTSYNCSLNCFCSHRLSGKAATEGGCGDTGISKFASVMSMQSSYFPCNMLSGDVRRKKILGIGSWRTYLFPQGRRTEGTQKGEIPKNMTLNHVSHLALWMLFSACAFCSPETLTCSML